MKTWLTKRTVLLQVFGKRDQKPTEDPLTDNPFADVRYDPNRKKFVSSKDEEEEEEEEDDEIREYKKSKTKKRDLERLLLKADERNISKKCKDICAMHTFSGCSVLYSKFCIKEKVMKMF